jgi:hypothetical protein
MLGDSDDESDAGQDDGMTRDERERRLNELVPGLAPEEWGSKTQKRDGAEEQKETGQDGGDALRPTTHLGARKL